MYIVKFFKGNYLWAVITDDFVVVNVKASSCNEAKKRARRMGYKVKNGWKWYCTIPKNGAVGAFELASLTL